MARRVLCEVLVSERIWHRVPYGYSRAELPLDGSVSLVAPNNTGKTSLINALQYLLIIDRRGVNFFRVKRTPKRSPRPAALPLPPRRPSDCGSGQNEPQRPEGQPARASLPQDNVSLSS